MTTIAHRPTGLIILDGWAHSEITEHNAIAQAQTPNFDRLWNHYPHNLINTSGEVVGLPDGQMGNSEVGHLNLGAGRTVYQSFTLISKHIETGEFNRNFALTSAIGRAVKEKRAVHIIGLLSDGGVHSHENHLHAAVRLAAQSGVEDIIVHIFTDGRDVAPKSALQYIDNMEAVFAEIGKGRIASIIGRYFALDRDTRWERTQKAYDLITTGEADFTATSAKEAVEMAYERGETDEFIQSTVITSSNDTHRMDDGDVAIFMNYRADRARQLTKAFITEDFTCFHREHSPLLRDFVTLTEYNKNFKVSVAFPPENLKNTFGEYVSDQGLKQLRIAETEKYAHVTFFLNGGKEEPFKGEDRILIPSPKVATYDLKPEMSVAEIADALTAAIAEGTYDTFICNFANPDMVGHSGDLEATIKAIEATDSALGRVMDAIEAADGELVVTADHGNAEKLMNEETGQPHTAHTTNPVPIAYFGKRPASIRDNGALPDVMPTLLHLMGLEKPQEMTGVSLIQLDA